VGVHHASKARFQQSIQLSTENPSRCAALASR